MSFQKMNVDKLLEGFEVVEREYECDICQDKGFVAATEEQIDNPKIKKMVDPFPINGVKYLVSCKCQLELEFERQLIKAGLKSVLNKIKNEEYIVKYDWQKEIKARCNNFIKNDSKCLIISGATGCGKTLILSKTVANMVYKGVSAKYIVWDREYDSKIKGDYKQDLNMDYIDELSNIELLYIDDALKVRNNDFDTLFNDYRMVTAFRMIINNRIDNGLKTIISTEWNKNHFKKLDESLYGRLLEITGKKEDSNWIHSYGKNQGDRNIRELIHEGKF